MLYSIQSYERFYEQKYFVRLGIKSQELQWLTSLSVPTFSLFNYQTKIYHVLIKCFNFAAFVIIIGNYTKENDAIGQKQNQHMSNGCFSETIGSNISITYEFGKLIMWKIENISEKNWDILNFCKMLKNVQDLFKRSSEKSKTIFYVSSSLPLNTPD